MTKYERYTSKDGATLTMSQWGGSPAELELYRKLAEIEDKIENDTLKFMPCKVGDTVYVVYSKTQRYPFECKVEFMKYVNGIWYVAGTTYGGRIGDTMFITKAEAQARLRGLQGERE